MWIKGNKRRNHRRMKILNHPCRENIKTKLDTKPCAKKEQEICWKKTRNVGIMSDDSFYENLIPKEMAEHKLPCIYDADNVCLYCKAYRFKEERSGFCCKNRQIKLPLQQDIPEELQNLYNNSHFLDNIRQYNNALALASIGCQEEVLPGFTPTIKIHGKVFHRIGALHPPDGQKPKFVQIYFHDTEHEVANRKEHNRNLDDEILETLQECMKSNNSYVKSLMYASQLSSENPDVNLVIHADKTPAREHRGTYNLLTE